MYSFTSDAAIMFSLAMVSVLLCGSMLASWHSLGGGRHALLWAGAFGVSAVQWALIGSYNSFLRITPFTFITATWLGAVMAVLLCLGFRQRVSAPLHPRWAIGGIVLSGALVVGFHFAHLGHDALSVPQFVRALCLPIAALTLIGPGRRPGMVEVMTAVVLLAFAGLSAVVGVYRVVDCGCENNSGRIILLLGLPVLFTGTGLASVQLLTSDLARQLRLAARIDPLTGALNRRGFEEAAERLLTQLRRRYRPMSVVLFDLDYFKSINDSFGHARGDEVLQQMARCVRDASRDGDLFGRVGGEEFALLLDKTSPSVARVIAERVRKTFAELPPLPDGRHPTASFGIASVLADGDLSLALVHADHALYWSKSAGRDCISHYDDMDQFELEFEEDDLLGEVGEGGELVVLGVGDQAASKKRDGEKPDGGDAAEWPGSALRSA